MGEIADSLIDGTFDAETGEYLGEGPGYPRIIRNGKIVPQHSQKPYNQVSKSIKKTSNCKELNGILKYFNKHKYFNTMSSAVKFIKMYCETQLEYYDGTTKQCAKEIQKDFRAFIKYCDEVCKKK